MPEFPPLRENREITGNGKSRGKQREKNRYWVRILVIDQMIPK